jgi:catechol 2,3-dioxygenase-like lactoylglutathione lyase family enzyme
MIARPRSIVLDCPDPKALAEFYSELLGLPVTDREEDWWAIGTNPGWKLAFQLAPNHIPPEWPDPERPQQFHLDVTVDAGAIDDAEARVLALGARRLEPVGTDFRVYADPAGHPFCLCWD